MKIKNPTLISLGNGKFYQRTDGPCLDVGAFAQGLIFASGCKQIILGKPNANYFNIALEMMGLSAEEVVMIGDDIVSDVGGAQLCGIRGIQVRTGKFRPEWENHAAVKPDLIADTLYHAVKTIADNGFNL
ncbi:unnamed protein product [Caenorhabditis auriculariae]|uniref:Phospholysine phosphohistidine inorganic pyrophosphate phosphatase n=1 Tax=Caenorhabditis auriculariae TaxID=2777116 RepID=A0A8S1H1J6_9PELO|nr:unnamed protein product [Caenorhabditis auriculariae]